MLGMRRNRNIFVNLILKMTNCLKNVLFVVLCVVHIVVWTFVLLAFLSRKTAAINLFVLIPAIYVLHLLPFHVLAKSKEMLCENAQESADTFSAFLILPKLFEDFSRFCEAQCTFNPISPQGMLVFGCITSAYRLRYSRKL